MFAVTVKKEKQERNETKGTLAVYLMPESAYETNQDYVHRIEFMFTVPVREGASENAKETNKHEKRYNIVYQSLNLTDARSDDDKSMGEFMWSFLKEEYKI